MALLEVNDLSLSFVQYDKGMRQKKLQVLHQVQLSVDSGEIVAVMGSSGSGKSLLAHSILGILPNNASVSGNIFFEGEVLDAKRQAMLRGREIALVPQSVEYLDPLMRVGTQVRQSVAKGDPTITQRRIFERFGLGENVERMFPFQLSGGMARRVLVSTAVASGARLIIADEPTPGLDPAIVHEALEQFRELADQGSAVVLISHDIESALAIADRVAVLYAGTTVEIARADDFSGNGESLRHPYTRALWQALPRNGFTPIPGAQPLPNAMPPGCAFAPRCAQAVPECHISPPGATKFGDRMVRCIHVS